MVSWSQFDIQRTVKANIDRFIVNFSPKVYLVHQRNAQQAY